MKKIIQSLMIMAMTTVCYGGFISCSGESPEADLFEAHSLLEGGDAESAQEICDNILSRTDSNKVGASNYGRLSVVFMELAEVKDQEDNIANAAMCFRRAYNINADSADSFYRNLTGDDQMRYAMLATIVTSDEIPFDSIGFEDPDYMQTNEIITGY